MVAVAALERLGLSDQIAEVLDTGTMLPQVAQGALAVECRADDDEILGVLGGIDDPVARVAVAAERAFLAEMGGGCTLPVGALAAPSGFSGQMGLHGDSGSNGDSGSRVHSGFNGAAATGGRGRTAAPGELSLEGLLASRDGRILLRRRVSGSDPVDLGGRLASDLLDHGGRILDEWDAVGDDGR